MFVVMFIKHTTSVCAWITKYVHIEAIQRAINAVILSDIECKDGVWELVMCTSWQHADEKLQI